MNIGDFLHSKRWKLMQNYIYSWGASVVLIGALFKLEHLPFASVFLGVGLSIEAIIFFVSAFEPIMDLPDWKLVYPQLRTGQESDREIDGIVRSDKKFPNFFGGGGGPGGGSISIKDLSEAQIKSLNESFEKLAVAAKGIQNISAATIATDGFVKNLNDASQSIGSVVQANQKVADVMDKSVKEIAESYKTAADTMKSSSEKASSGIEKTLSGLSSSLSATADTMKSSGEKASTGIEKTLSGLSASLGETAESMKSSSVKAAKNMEVTTGEFAKQVKTTGDQLATSYQEMTSSLVNGFKGLEKSSGTYVDNIGKLNKNLAAINTAYEIHLKGAGQVEQMVKEYSKGVNEIGKLLSTSVEETKKFNQSTKEINENIQALNGIYGKMLGALNGKK